MSVVASTGERRLIVDLNRLENIKYFAEHCTIIITIIICTSVTNFTRSTRQQRTISKTPEIAVGFVHSSSTSEPELHTLIESFAVRKNDRAAQNGYSP